MFQTFEVLTMEAINAAIAAGDLKLAASLNETLQMYFKNQKRLAKLQAQHLEIIGAARVFVESAHPHPQPPVAEETTERISSEMPEAYYLSFEAGEEYHHSALAAFNKLKKLSGDARCVLPNGEAGQTRIPKNNPDLLENGFQGYLIVSRVPVELHECIAILKEANVAEACDLPEELLD